MTRAAMPPHAGSPDRLSGGPDRRRTLVWLSATAVLPLLRARPAQAASPQALPPQPLASPWVPAHNGRARLIAARVGGAPMAGIEIELADGWKTYWRHPGDAGGVPPNLDWQGSANLAEATLLFPAPVRFRDAAGIIVGYKHHVVLPIELKPKVPDEPIGLSLALEYGICREICIPAEATVSLTLPASAPNSAASEHGETAAVLAGWLARVPRPAGKAGANDPVARDIQLVRDAEQPRLVFSVDPAGADPATVDAFVECPQDLFVPQPQRRPQVPGAPPAFAVDLGVDGLRELSGKAVRLTLVSERGQSETIWTVP